MGGGAKLDDNGISEDGGAKEEVGKSKGSKEMKSSIGSPVVGSIGCVGSEEVWTYSEQW